MPRRPHTLTRRAFAVLLAAGGAAALSSRQRGQAQEATPAAVASPAAGSLIRPTDAGEVPSSGASRPGPAGRVAPPLSRATVAPIGLAIEKAGVDAAIENLRVVDGAMPDPTGPWVVAWYENLGGLGHAGNVVMAGHIDYWNVGPSVFYNLTALQPGDEIVVRGDNDKLYPFTVDWVEQFDSTSIPLDTVTGPTDDQALTLITCGGAFDYANGQYLQRTVVRAHR